MMGKFIYVHKRTGEKKTTEQELTGRKAKDWKLIREVRDTAMHEGESQIK